MALSEFQKAFKAARDEGKTEFDFGGKMYNTKYKEEESVPPMKAEPKASQEFPMSSAPAYKADRNILEEAKEEARRRLAGAASVAPKRRAPTKFEGKFPGSGALSGMKKGGKVSSASSRADGCAQRGKTKGRMI